MIFFTSDTHFGHEAAARWRGFDGDVRAMDDELIRRWNHVVPPAATVYHLGDLSFHRDEEEIERILLQLNGQIHLVAGNHDDDSRKLRGLETVRDLRYVSLTLPHGARQKAMLCHYPMVTWRSSHYGTWMLHGHCHGMLDEARLPEAKRLDVGVDTNDLFPYTLGQIADYMGSCGFDQVDHHAWKGQ